VLDTSVLIGAEGPGDLEGAISAASLAELHSSSSVQTRLVTHNVNDFQVIDDLVDVRRP
jgi:hypothetical protein